MRRHRVLSARPSGVAASLSAVTRLLLALAAALPALTLAPGCADRAALGARGRAVAPLTVHMTDLTSSVRLSPLYREAQTDCRAQDFLSAADALRRLSAMPGLTPDQLAFCREQRALCLRDAGRPVPASAPALPPSASPTPAVAPTPARADCGPRALALVCARLHRPCSLTALRRAAGTTAKGTTLAGLARAAESVGLRATGEQVDLPALSRLSGPAIAWVDGDHYVAVLSVDGETATVHDPNRSREEDIPTRALLARSGGVLLTLAR